MENHYIIELEDIHSIKEAHACIKAAMHFPDYYGENWDAFWDCATDRLGRPLYIEVRGIERMRQINARETQIFLETLKDLKHVWHDRYADIIRIVIVTGDMRTEIG
ncbi:MAG: barstar family protein [Clostridia bacterium]|nr:barstar family protein [Clostridia bacterium]